MSYHHTPLHNSWLHHKNRQGNAARYRRKMLKDALADMSALSPRYMAGTRNHCAYLLTIGGDATITVVFPRLHSTQSGDYTARWEYAKYHTIIGENGKPYQTMIRGEGSCWATALGDWEKKAGLRKDIPYEH